MSGEPIAWAKAVAAQLLSSLTPVDRFEVLAFSDRVTALTNGLLEATQDNLTRALALLERLHAGGGTEMASALERALQPLRPHSQRQVVLLTDGYIGFEGEVVGKVLQRLPAAARLHTVGIGSAPNRTLTRGAARAGRGVETLVNTAGEVYQAAARLVRATAGPVLTELAVSGTSVRSLAPERPRDVLAGQPIVLALRLEAKGGTLEVSGRLAGSEETWRHHVPIGPEGGEADLRSGTNLLCQRTQLPIGALYGREAIEDQGMLLAAGEDDRSGASQDILSRIEELGLRHRITSRRTSLVAVCEDPTVDPSDPRRREGLAVEVPYGVSAEGVGLGQSAIGPPRSVRIMGGGAFTGRDVPLNDAVLGLSLPYDAKLERGRPGIPQPAAPDARLRRFWKVLSRYAHGAPVPEAKREEAILPARCLRLDADLAVLEFESPRDGFRLPAAGEAVQLFLEDGLELAVRIDAELSTRPGPHTAGLTLRLALRTSDGSDWPKGTVLLYWTASGHRVTGCVEAA